MHYRNGREAKNGDKVVSLAGYGSGPVNINAIGILFDATPGNDYCNGFIAPTQRELGHSPAGMLRRRICYAMAGTWVH
mgnify:CR=1 FL=1